MDVCSSAAANVVRAIAVAVDWSSSTDDRKNAISYLESIKDGDIGVLAGVSFILVKKDQSSQIRLHGLKMLQHLVRLRWGGINEVERRNFSSAVMNLIADMADPCEEWALKSQMAALIAEIARREGLHFWQELLPFLTSISRRGPVEGELVAMVLRWLPEDITVHNEDLEGDRLRVLLRCLTQYLPEILPLLYSLLERNFGAVLDDASKLNFALAKMHAATVTAIMHALNAYAEWAPVSELARYGLIKGCGFLLSSLEFRLHASEFFKILCQRKRPVDESSSEFDDAIEGIHHILIKVSTDFLQRSRTNPARIDGSEFEFIECICEGMVYLGTSGLPIFSKDGSLFSTYLQQMLGYFQHFKFQIHLQSLQFWLSLMREISSKAKVSMQCSGENLIGGNTTGSGSDQVIRQKKAMAAFVGDDVCSAILDVAFHRMLKKLVLPGSTFPPGILELWSDDFDGNIGFSQYRSKLLELSRLVTIHKPSLTVGNICHKIDVVLNGCSQDPVSAQVLPLLETLHLGLETVVNAAFIGPVGSEGSVLEAKLGMCRILEGLLQQLLCLNWKEPVLVILLGRYLDAFGPFLKCFPDSVGAVIDKLFKLLTSLPCVLEDPSASNARVARLQLCTSFIRIARDADKSLLPHMQVIADTMGILEAEGRLLRGERNLLSEAFLLMGSSAGFKQQEEVLAWLLEPLSRQWTQSEWQNTFLSEPLGLIHLCSDKQFMWSIFHSITFFEKALKRSGMKSSGNPNDSTAVQKASSVTNPMTSHLSWMLPPLLKLLRCVHALWSNQVTFTLPVEMRAAMSMSNVEQASLLGEGITKGSKFHGSDGSNNDTSADGLGGTTENDLRNWLKGIRDSGYNVLGMAATIGEDFFRCLDCADVALALMENIQSMEFRHIRQLIHLTIIPLVKFCPQNLWNVWLEGLLHPLFVHVQQALSCSWSSLLHEGRAKVPDMFGNLAGLDLKLEVMEEKLLRALTREVCSLLSVASSPSLNSGLPSLDHLGSANRVEISSLKNLDVFASTSLICFILVHEGLALPALQITLLTFASTDGEAVSKIVPFCGVVILLSISSNSIKLRGFVAKDLFIAIIQSLTLESNAIIGSELVGLCREIFFYLAVSDPAPKQVLLSIPGINMKDLLAFEDALEKTNSPKDQRQHMRSLLLLASDNKFRSLAAQKTTIITNLSYKSRGSTTADLGHLAGDDETVGLASIT